MPRLGYGEAAEELFRYRVPGVLPSSARGLGRATGLAPRGSVSPALASAGGSWPGKAGASGWQLAPGAAMGPGEGRRVQQFGGFQEGNFTPESFSFPSTRIL